MGISIMVQTAPDTQIPAGFNMISQSSHGTDGIGKMFQHLYHHRRAVGLFLPARIREEEGVEGIDPVAAAVQDP